MRKTLRWTGAALALALLPLAGCDRGGQSESGAEGDEKARAVAEEAAAPVGQLPQGVSADVGEEGRKLYGRACVMCHAEGGEGTQLGPSLVDATWSNGRTGTFEEIVQVVREGAVPADSIAAYPTMPARGDGTFTEDQVRAVSAYTYSLSRRQ